MNPSGPNILELARKLCPPDHDILEIPFGDNPRLLIPMGDAQVRHSSLNLNPALRARSRVHRTLLRTWTLLGGVRYTHHINPKRKEDWALGELLRPDIPELSTAAIYVGTHGPDQKLTIQLMDHRGDVLGYAKYANEPRSRSLVANEARILNMLPEGIGPRVIRFTPFLQGDLLVQTPLPGRVRVPSTRVYAGQMKFLERLTRPEGAYDVSMHPFVKDLYARAGKRRSVLERVVSDLEGSEWPLAWMHGDLSAWNMRWCHDRCRAFDWEYGRSEGMMYVEAPHAQIQFSGLVRNISPQKAKRGVSYSLRTFLPARYKSFASGMASLSALNMLISWYPPRKPDAYESWLSAFVEAAGD